MEITTVKHSDGSWMAKGTYNGQTRFECAWTKKEAIKRVRVWFGDWSVLN